eukprot:SAG11_NODE_1741_length_4336_cov_1.517583_8_plen_42_part_00
MDGDGRVDEAEYVLMKLRQMGKVRPQHPACSFCLWVGSPLG